MRKGYFGGFRRSWSIGAADFSRRGSTKFIPTLTEGTQAELQSAFNRIDDQNTMLFDQTVQAVRSALQSGLKVLFLIGSVALLFILTIPEVSMDAEVQDKNPGS